MSLAYTPSVLRIYTDTNQTSVPYIEQSEVTKVRLMLKHIIDSRYSDWPQKKHSQWCVLHVQFDVWFHYAFNFAAFHNIEQNRQWDKTKLSL